MSGLLISFEGSEGAGKGTQVQLLKEQLEASGITVELTREPGGTAVGERIRYLLKHDVAGKTMLHQTELLLFIAARAQNYHERILPALQQGKVVICDRFIDSSLVYQGHGRGLGVEVVEWLNNYATASRRPDLTFLLDIPTHIGMMRVGKRTPQEQLALDIKLEGAPTEELHDRLEEMGTPFFDAVRHNYLALAKSQPERFVVINAAGDDRHAIAKEIWQHVHTKLAALTGQ
jgi:dTMP kinase